MSQDVIKSKQIKNDIIQYTNANISFCNRGTEIIIHVCIGLLPYSETGPVKQSAHVRERLAKLLTGQ